jgi:hypothetical protein
VTTARLRTSSGWPGSGNTPATSPCTSCRALRSAQATNPRGEPDLIGYLAEQVVIGEVRTSADWFTEDQVRKDLALAVQVRADLYVTVAVIAISEQQKTMADALAAAQGYELLTFSGPETSPAAPGSE